MLVNGDKIVAKKNVRNVIEEGDICKVVNVDEDTITFAFGNGFVHKGVMTFDEYVEYFEKYVEKKSVTTVTQKLVEEIMLNSDIKIQTICDKCTIVACRLPNGFVIVESSASVDPNNYDEEIGVDICLDRIAEKIWELEGYKLQSELYEKLGTDECLYDCNECPCEGCKADEEYDEFEEDKCLDTDLDCDDCEDYDCPYNQRYYI